MVWVKLHDGIYDSVKLRSVNHRARWVWVAGIAFCNRHLTDGHVPEWALAVIDGKPADANELLDAGLWERVEDGWRIHDYAEYQPGRDDVNGHRADRSEAARRAANIRWHGNADA